MDSSDTNWLVLAFNFLCLHHVKGKGMEVSNWRKDFPVLHTELECQQFINKKS